jgi:hypothetical protein
MSDELQRMLDAINFVHITREESKRTVLCEPHREHEVRAAVDQAGAADILTVRPSPACPEGKLLVIDEGALGAQLNEWLQGGLTRRWLP